MTTIAISFQSASAGIASGSAQRASTLCDNVTPCDKVIIPVLILIIKYILKNNKVAVKHIKQKGSTK